VPKRAEGGVAIYVVKQQLPVINLGASARTDGSQIRFGGRLSLKDLQKYLNPGDTLVFGYYTRTRSLYESKSAYSDGTYLKRTICSDGTSTNSGTSIVWTQAMDTAADATAWLAALRVAGRNDVKIFDVGGDFIDYCLIIADMTSRQMLDVVFMPFAEIIPADSAHIDGNEGIGAMKYNNVDKLLNGTNHASIIVNNSPTYPYPFAN
jgi:hypothetical protein